MADHTGMTAPDTPRAGDADRENLSPDAFERADIAIDLAQRRGMSLRLAVAAAIESAFRDGKDALAAALREKDAEIERLKADNRIIKDLLQRASEERNKWFDLALDNKNEIERLRAAPPDTGEMPHPWYGPCDALGPNGICAECGRHDIPEARAVLDPHGAARRGDG